MTEENAIGGVFLAHIRSDGGNPVPHPLPEHLGKVADLAAEFAAGCYPHPRSFQPFPLMGLPGVTPANETASYYDDRWQFRPGRGRRGV